MAYVCLLYITVSCTKKDRNVLLVQVGEHKLMSTEFAGILAVKLKQFNMIEVKNPKTVETIKAQIVSEFINDALFDIWGNQNGIRVTASELNDELNKMKNSYKTSLSFEEALANADTTLRQLKAKVKNSLLKKKVFIEFKKSITPPTEGDIKTYYDQNKAQFTSKSRLRIEQIIFSKKEDADLTYEQLANGNIPETVRQRIERHWIYKGGLPVFEEAFKMKLNKWSNVLQSEYGYHIYRVLLKEEGRVLSFEKAKGMVETALIETRQQAKYSDWLEDMLSKTEIFKNEEALRKFIIEVS